MRRVEIKEYQSGCGRNRNPNLPSRSWGLGFHRSIQFPARVTSIVGAIYLCRPTMSAYHGRQSLALSLAPLAQAANDGPCAGRKPAPKVGQLTLPLSSRLGKMFFLSRVEDCTRADRAHSPIPFFLANLT